MGHVTADWTPLGDVFYRTIELYDMAWKGEIDITKYHIAAAPYGGPIALSKKHMRMSGAKPLISIYSAAGRLMADINWEGGNLVQMGWSVSEDLFCVAEDGRIYVYTLSGDFIKVMTTGQEGKEFKVIDCRFFSSSMGSGITILTSRYHFYTINKLEDKKTRELATPPGLNAPPSSWITIPEERKSHVLVAVESFLYSVTSEDVVLLTPEISEQVNAFTEMALSINHKYLALYADTGLVWIGSSDLKTVYCEFNTRQTSRPEQLAWCGNGAVICYWQYQYMMIGPDKDVDTRFIEDDVYLVPEIDGIRIVSNEKHEFLQKVPSVVENVFKIGSVESGAMLYEAMKEFEKKSAKADEYIRLIKPKLPEAVRQCVQAAGSEFEPTLQRSLLRAASFGKSFVDELETHKKYVEMCQILRVLNAVREHTVGVPLTLVQLDTLSMDVLIKRLMLRRQYCLAMRISNYLKIPKSDGESRILAHWACYKVQQMNKDEENIALAIATKLGDAPGISYTAVASQAVKCGRGQLALRLLEYESKAADQVPLLIRMKNNQLALEKAIESGDTDLVYLVVMDLKEEKQLKEFLMTLRHFPVAFSLFVKFCKEQDKKTLENLYTIDDQFLNLGNLYLHDSFTKTTSDERRECLKKSLGYFTQGNLLFPKQMVEEQIKLLEKQKSLEEKLRLPGLYGLSVSDTISQCVHKGHYNEAEQLKKEFKVPDKRYYWLKLRALAKAREWMKLEEFSKSKKSPIGYEPFFEACFQFDNIKEAEKYISRVPLEERMNCYIRVGNIEQAANVAFNQKNEEALNSLLGRCGTNRTLVSKIETMKTQLSQRKK
ncbi:vacuolar protein sorting-associated protein 16 homolog [Dendronephthya gigantea]|uniref:vacuolar protein sorting-associated protein 16 homolog n=1 Tax=Dendronephthya gigantea TaxID=151771 RepID=UPI00106BF620|nr:vacuolar protein sorting-associated protein 16 homolog [Dendronephthya gigantea]XP_028391432.1 vacuolar protein sorting-associated protein 16 homolog [Dendronephthya gigantea]XP_028391440.1 vacuolar protein sorting-associated protein 16 homolog [Dendronephthya gigantea]